MADAFRTFLAEQRAKRAAENAAEAALARQEANARRAAADAAKAKAAEQQQSS